MSVPRSPVPQRRLANLHHHSDGPYPTAASRATYTATGQPNPTIESRRYFDTISEPLRTPIAPTAATNGSVGTGSGAAARTAFVEDPTAVPGMGGGSELIGGARDFVKKTSRNGHGDSRRYRRRPMHRGTSFDDLAVERQSDHSPAAHPPATGTHDVNQLRFCRHITSKPTSMDRDRVRPRAAGCSGGHRFESRNGLRERSVTRRLARDRQRVPHAIGTRPGVGQPRMVEWRTEPLVLDAAQRHRSRRGSRNPRLHHRRGRGRQQRQCGGVEQCVGDGA